MEKPELYECLSCPECIDEFKSDNVVEYKCGHKYCKKCDKKLEHKCIICQKYYDEYHEENKKANEMIDIELTYRLNKLREKYPAFVPKEKLHKWKENNYDEIICIKESEMPIYKAKPVEVELMHKSLKEVEEDIEKE